MKKKTKLILSIFLLVLVALVILSVILISKFTNQEEDSFEVWREKPYIYTDPTDTERIYSSYKEAFASAFSALEYELEASSTDGKELKMIASYTSSEGTPTAIVAYNTTDLKIKLLVCKYKDGKFFKTYIETELTGFDGQNSIAIVNNSDIIAIRSGIGSETGRQVIYDFYEESYAAVKDNSYESPDVSDMDSTLAEYYPSLGTYLEFNAVAEQNDVSSALSRFTEK